MDWLLVRYSLPDDPQITALATALKADVDLVVGKLLRVWAHAGLHGQEGFLRYAGPAVLDNVGRLAGLGLAMAQAGLCTFELEGCRLWTSSTPADKRRAKDMQRKGYSVPVVAPAPLAVPAQEPDLLPEPEPVPLPKRAPKPKRAKLAVSMEAFDKFWLAYPEKKGKLAALRIWKRLAPSEELLKTILAAVETQKSWKKWQDGFVPNPATWLHQGRWEDQESGKVKPTVPTMSEKEYKEKLAADRKKAKDEEAELMRRRVAKAERELTPPAAEPAADAAEIQEADAELFEAFLDEPPY